MYDQSSDFFDYTILNKPDLPDEEIILIPDENGWIYEHINNNDWNLSDLKINNIDILGQDCAIEFLKQKYPNAEISIYDSRENWELDKKSGCFK